MKSIRYIQVKPTSYRLVGLSYKPSPVLNELSTRIPLKITDYDHPFNIEKFVKTEN